jgi:[acyl-carrier-protein] S-malonyltransferase
MKVAWIFPGQGSQEVGMGRDVAETFAAAKAVFASADEAFARAGDARSLSSLCFEGPIEALTLTENTQPALVATQAALVAAIREAHPGLPAPVVAMGHSLGEYAALVAAGALSLADAVRLCRVRGAAMQAAVPAGAGAMAAVIGTDDAVILAACAEASQEGSPVSPANFNAPGQTVIAGSSEAVKRATELLAAKGAKTIPLKVSAPFHCALMRPAATELERALAEVTLGAMQFPVVANVDAAPNDDPSRVKDLLVRQVDGPVLWIKCVERAVALGVDVMVEVGPGKVLAGLIKRIDKKLRVVSVSDAASVASLASALSG